MPRDTPESGTFADNIVFFSQALRRAGLKIGAGSIIDAIGAADAIGIGTREEFHAALCSTLVKRREDRPVFDDAFRLFWLSPAMIRKMMALMSPLSSRSNATERHNPGRKRVSSALMNDRRGRQPPPEEPNLTMDARLTASASEVLRTMDFAQMSAAEISAAKKEIARLQMPLDLVRTRRFAPSDGQGHADPRATMRAFLRSGGDILLPHYRTPKKIHPPLVVLADISGSMSQYSRIFLHFLHVLTARRRRVSTFLFGTRLTNVTRQMRHKDPDEALADCTAAVKDWSGGTRVGEILKEFNRLWARRVLGQGAVVLLITDGLERDDVDLLEAEIDRLHRSCRRLIWLNPLLRYDGFEARAKGVVAMLPHVDEFRPVHNLVSIGALASALATGTRKP